MKKLTQILLAALLIGAVAFTGCQAIDDFKEDRPVAYDLIKGTAKALLLSQVPQITEDGAGQFALRTVIDAAFDRASAPGDVALALQEGVASVYPDDTSLQRLIVDEWANVLAAEPDPTVPASGPAHTYQLQLADALAATVANDSELAPVYASPASARNAAYVTGTPWVTTPEARVRYGPNWSDPIWAATAWFSGCDSYAGFRDFHSY